MNQKNFDYLKEQVKFTGFGDSLENDLREAISKQQPAFTLLHNRKFGNDEVAAVLSFKAAPQSDVYFFNSYELHVKQEKAKETVKQTFYIGKENNYTLKEAFNLLAGRAVFKELNKLEKTEGEAAAYKPTGETYNAWVQLDFKNTDTNGNFKMKYFHENYGFDLVAALEKHPIKELGNDQERSNLIQSLEKGNRQSATFIIDNKEQKRFIEAAPQWKSLNVYDGNNKRIREKQKDDDNSTSQGQRTNIKKESKQKAGSEEEGGEKKETTKTKRKRQGIT